MKQFFKSSTVTTGLAIFSMFFGAGNVVFPLVIGRYAGDKNIYAVLGFLITAVGAPFLGLVSMVLFDGDYKKFFGRLGNLPGMFSIVASMVLIGPFVAIPRCIALSYSTMKNFLPGTTLFYFSLVSASLLFLFSVRKSRVVDILGKILSPILLVSLVIIIVKGFINAPEAIAIYGRRRVFLLEGLVQGYNTMDIFAGFFFSAVVLIGLKSHLPKTVKNSYKVLVKSTLRAGVIGLSLLGLIYTGFSYVSSFHAYQLAAVEPDTLISAIAFYVLGNYAGVIACVAVSLACLTTAIALTVVFSGFLRREILSNTINYEFAVLITSIIAFAFSNIGFTKIVNMVEPILSVCYPALIVLAIFNIAYKVWNVQVVKTPVFITLAFALLFSYPFNIILKTIGALFY